MRKSVKTLAVAAGLLAVAGTAHADVDINIWGASAQWTLWTKVAQAFLTNPASPDGGMACATIDGSKSNGSNQYIITASGCPTYGKITIRAASKASYDGLYALNGAPTAGCYPATTECCANPLACTTDEQKQRKFYDAFSSTDPNTCKYVNAAASDVQGASFTQTTKGCEYGPVYDRSGSFVYGCMPPTGKSCSQNTDNTKKEYCWYEASCNGVDTSNLTNHNPLVVPFGFFANTTLQVNRCVDGANAGNLCDPTLGTTSNPACDDTTAHACAPQTTPINMSQIMAANIFSRTITAWTDFGGAFTSTAGHNNLRTCYRHSGSGTHATLDKAVMKAATGFGLTQEQSSTCKPTATNWPTCLPTTDAAGNTGAQTWFNVGSGEMANCINGFKNGIGYLDADYCAGNPTKCTSVNAMAYQGVMPYRENVRNGQYTFWSKQNLYTRTDLASTDPNANTVINALVTYLKPTNINSTDMPAAYKYWTSVAEMRFNKDTDVSYPKKKTPTTVVKP